MFDADLTPTPTAPTSMSKATPHVDADADRHTPHATRHTPTVRVDAKADADDALRPTLAPTRPCSIEPDGVLVAVAKLADARFAPATN